MKKIFSFLCGGIASRLAFHPPTPTYTLREIEAPPVQDLAQDEQVDPTVCLPPLCSLHLTKKADWTFSQRELDMIDVFRCTTKRGNSLGCMYVRCAPGSRYTLLYSHGNAYDLGEMCRLYIALGSKIKCNIFSYDYSGYGVSSGIPSEKNIYADIDAAWHALRTRYGVPEENIILYGFSIGTVAAIDLATRYKCAALILESALMSGLRVFFPNIRKTYCCDPFPSIDKIAKVTCPVLIMHGTNDRNVHFSHALALYNRCPQAVWPLWIKGGGHCNLGNYERYRMRLQQFIWEELPNI